MGHDEKAVGLFRTDKLVLVDQAGLPHGNIGTVILSGAKLLLDTGTTWEVITSV